MCWMRLNPNCNDNRCAKVTLKTTRMKNVKLKIVKIRTDCQYTGYFNYSENLNWAAQNLRWAACGRVGHSWFSQIYHKAIARLYPLFTNSYHLFDIVEKLLIASTAAATGQSIQALTMFFFAHFPHFAVLQIRPRVLLIDRTQTITVYEQLVESIHLEFFGHNSELWIILQLPLIYCMVHRSLSGKVTNFHFILVKKHLPSQCRFF